MLGIFIDVYYDLQSHRNANGHKSTKTSFTSGVCSSEDDKTNSFLYLESSQDSSCGYAL